LPNSRSVDWRTVRQASRILAKYRPAILHTHFTGPASLWPWLARLHSVRTNFFTDHISRPEGYVTASSSTWKKALGRVLNQPLTNLVAVSDYNAQVCRAAGLVAGDRVRRIYNGVDLGRAPGDPEMFRRKFGIPDNRAVVVQVSWMIPEKGIGDLLEAARLVLAEDSRVQFVMVGEGSGRTTFMETATSLGIADHFTWTGLVDDPVAEGVYAAARVVCQLSRWQEAFGWTNTEAMASGKPVIATRVGGVPEIVEDGVSGFLVERRQPGESAARILQLLRDPVLSAQLGQGGCAAVRDRFDLRRNVGELLRLYGITAAKSLSAGL
jgi:glycosyltransferase involved in cell wall biosynthesis